MSDETPKHKPEDRVLSVSVFRSDPFCTEYSFEVDSKVDADQPVHLEQLTVLKSVLDNYIQQAERKLLFTIISKDREDRKKLKAEVDDMGVVPPTLH